MHIDLLRSLPPIPAISQEILSINLATDKGDELLLKLIGKDPAISARIIGLANSPLFHTTRRILTVGDAAAVLGINRIKMISLSFSMISSMARKLPGLLNVMNLWQHSMAVALAMDTLSRAMPKEIRPPDEEIYLAGLLHDIGFLVLDHIDPELSNRFHARLATEVGRSTLELEAEMLEMNHCDLGALLTEHWNLPASITAVLRHHHSYDATGLAAGQPLLVMANLAEKLLPTFGMQEPLVAEIGIEEWQALGIDVGQVDEIEMAMRKCGDEIAMAFA
ncbi:MAG: HDOD domain-containing protein [Gallionella sp.]